jgi:phenylpyruvate tautomerase PptA (4-oxalocrotonate tautomerase family)
MVPARRASRQWIIGPSLPRLALSPESESREAAVPKLDLTVSPGALSPEAKRDLPRQLAAVMLKWEGAPDSRFARSIAWVHVHELADGAVHDGDGPTDEPHLILETTVPAGVLSERRRAGLIAEATEAIRAAAGLDRADSIWVIVHEVPEGYWGSAGEVVRLENLRAAVMRAGAPVTR